MNDLRTMIEEVGNVDYTDNSVGIASSAQALPGTEDGSLDLFSLSTSDDYAVFKSAVIGSTSAKS